MRLHHPLCTDCKILPQSCLTRSGQSYRVAYSALIEPNNSGGADLHVSVRACSLVYFAKLIENLPQRVDILAAESIGLRIEIRHCLLGG